MDLLNEYKNHLLISLNSFLLRKIIQ